MSERSSWLNSVLSTLPDDVRASLLRFQNPMDDPRVTSDLFRSVVQIPNTLAGGFVDMSNAAIGALDYLGGGRGNVHAVAKPYGGKQNQVELTQKVIPSFPTEPGSHAFDTAITFAAPGLAMNTGRALYAGEQAVAQNAEPMLLKAVETAALPVYRKGAPAARARRLPAEEPAPPPPMTDVANIAPAAVAPLTPLEEATAAAVNVRKPRIQTVARSREYLNKTFPDDPDIVSSLLNDPKYKKTGRIPRDVIDLAKSDRALSRAEPPTLPKPAKDMTDADWQAWGAQHGVDMTVTPSKSLGVSDVATKREIAVPGGLEGKFTVPDVFQIKSENFDPAILGQDIHNELMKKFIRTYERPGGTDAVDQFNALNFSLLSPNAPLGPNEFLAQRFRVRDADELSQLADTPAELLRLDERGMGSAARGGMGVKGTANLGNMQQLAETVRDYPHVFTPGPDETLRDVARRVMNQVPGLGPKTSSLGVPWFNLAKGNTSAVDLHIIKDNYPRLMQDAQLGPDFTRKLGVMVGMPDAGAEALLARAAQEPRFKSLLDKKAISIVGGNVKSNAYRLKGGELNPEVHPSLAPDRLAFEPVQAKEFGPYYNKIVDYVDEGRGANPAIELFPEQWRKWDVLRGRVEPHEMAHPDFRKLPPLSWEEMFAAKQAQQKAGYFSKKGKSSPDKTPGKVPWGRLYYGNADPLLLGGTGAATGAGLLAAYALREKE